MENASHFQGTFHGYYVEHERSRFVQQNLCTCQFDLRLCWRQKNSK